MRHIQFDTVCISALKPHCAHQMHLNIIIFPHIRSVESCLVRKESGRLLLLLPCLRRKVFSSASSVWASQFLFCLVFLLSFKKNIFFFTIMREAALKSLWLVIKVYASVAAFSSNAVKHKWCENKNSIRQKHYKPDCSLQEKLWWRCPLKIWSSARCQLQSKDWDLTQFFFFPPFLFFFFLFFPKLASRWRHCLRRWQPDNISKRRGVR